MNCRRTIHHRLFWISILVIATAGGTPWRGRAAEPSAADLDFFEKKIRPVLVRHCHECHASDSDQLQGGLLLDSRAGWLAGGDSGPAIVPGEPEESLLVQALRYTEDGYQMPPDGKLPDAVIADFEHWIERGAVDPRDAPRVARTPTSPPVADGDFWSFQPILVASPPPVQQTAWPRSPIDHFILAAIEQAGLQPADDVDRRTLVRRLYFDLLGLPPTPAQIEAFVHDPSPQALVHLVDRLLASPHFGERWGRHWLDIARFAESSGGGRTLIFPNAWRYRDYVIHSLNQDKPYREFILEQIAGDLLPYASLEERHEHLVATGLLALGPTNYELQDKDLLRMEVVDEQMDTIGRAMLGLTIGCARCHDHKFDPIPTRDYYALAGIFRSTKTFLPGNVARFIEVPLWTKEDQQRQAEHAQQLAQLETALQQAQQDRDLVRQRLTQLDTTLGGSDPLIVDDEVADVQGNWQSSSSVTGFVGKRYLHDGNREKGQKGVIYRFEIPHSGVYAIDISYTAGTNRASNVPVTVRHRDGQTTLKINQRQAPDLDGQFAAVGQFALAAQTPAEIVISNEGTNGHVIADAVRLVLLEPEAAEGSRDSTERQQQIALRRQLRSAENTVRQLRQQRQQLEQQGFEPAAQTMSVLEEEKTEDWHVLIRGEIRNLGPPVPRGFLSVLSDAPPQIPADESGRRQLAEWIASEENPLTARVMANRVWQHLLGEGLVRTPDNFGAMGQPPTHPELLDYLAAQLMRKNWSIKALVRQIVLSRTYALSQPVDSAHRQADPTNRLFSYRSLRRLEGEVLRDAMLYVAGQLDLTAGNRTIRPGTSSELNYRFDSPRRSVYVPSFRNTQLDFLEIFDAANPNVVTGRRTVSSVPTQALFLMNSPLVQEQAQAFAQNLLRSEADEATRLQQAFQQALGRQPTAQEQTLQLQYLRARQEEGMSPHEVWTQVCHMLLTCIDFRWIE